MGIQLRRSISMRPGAYERLRIMAEREGEPMAAVVESLVDSRAALQGIQVDDDEARVRAVEKHAARQKARADRLARLQREAFGA